jgi:AraC-like DNA-binding protein
VEDGLYREAPPPPDLAAHVACVWYRRIGAVEAARPVRIVPDGCMDLMWGSRGGLLVAGPDRTAQVSRMAAGTTFVGLRFRPGAAPPLLGVLASELVDGRPEAAALWGRAARELSARLDDARTPGEVAALLRDAVRRRLANAPTPDPAVQHVAAAVRRRPSIRIGQLAEELGLGERQLHRRCCAALGYGPKTFAGIARFQRFLGLASGTDARPLALAARLAGYADQPHLSREVRRLAGLSPAQLLAELAG